ncbi:MAG: hypothetical protein J5822_04870 [Eubacteriaceae bacterium]|nr:hypothetical protein [Eubacteriaceae bacterium]
MKYVNKFIRKYPKFHIDNLMLHISLLTLVVYVVHYVFRAPLIGYLVLDRSAVLAGQIWRLVSFVLVPADSRLLYFIISIYFYYYLGNTLEHTWGSQLFTIYYLICMLGSILACMLSGTVFTGVYINLSIFLAFAYLYPDQEILLFFVLPVKVKYLAYLDLALMAVSFIMGGLATKLMIISSFSGLLVFFGKDLMLDLKLAFRRMKNRMK